MELYRKVIIKSEDDLPKEKGWYFIHVGGLPKGEDGTDVADWGGDTQLWMNTFDWYLLPVEPEIPMKEIGIKLKVRLSAGIYLTFHEELKLSLADCDNITEFVSQYTEEYTSQFTTKEPEPLSLRDEIIHYQIWVDNFRHEYGKDKSGMQLVNAYFDKKQ